MDVVALSEMALLLGAFLGALAVSLVGLRIQVKRDTEAWARSYWEAGTRQLVEIEAKAASQTLSLDDEPPPVADDGGPVSEGDPDEDPAERRRRERQERAARIRERIAQKRIAEKVMEESPDDVPANYVGPPAFGGEGATGEVEAVARRALGFDMQVIYHNRSRLPEDKEAACRARWVDKQTLLREADFLVLLLPLILKRTKF
jgi:hypothetical protein